MIVKRGSEPKRSPPAQFSRKDPRRKLDYQKRGGLWQPPLAGIISGSHKQSERRNVGLVTGTMRAWSTPCQITLPGGSRRHRNERSLISPQESVQWRHKCTLRYFWGRCFTRLLITTARSVRAKTVSLPLGRKLRDAPAVRREYSSISDSSWAG